MRVAVCEGDLDLDRAAKIAKRMNKGKGIKIFPEDANSRTIEKARRCFATSFPQTKFTIMN